MRKIVDIFFRSGDPFIWLCGGALAIILLLLSGLFLVVLSNGMFYFWPVRVAQLSLSNGEVVIGEVVSREAITPSSNQQVTNGDILQPKFRLQIKRGNRDLWGSDFIWVNEEEIKEINFPPDLFTIERRQWGNFYGRIIEMRDDESITSLIEKSDLESIVNSLRGKQNATIVVEVAGKQIKELALSEIIHANPSNRLSFFERLALYLKRLISFVFENPRESNTEGGVFPAIFGTVMMVILMSIAATPLGVLTAIYLHEYAKPGRFVSLVRIAVNNLAGVPSIVFGVFGLGFFVYYVGGGIDRIFFSDSLPNPTFGTGGILWASLTLALLTMPTVIVAAEEGLSAIPKTLREASYALGATKWETTIRVVLPSLMPSILTGLILAVARAAGEVAPLMITGVVKLAPALPIDNSWPFLHLDRKFMHLGFHIYDVGFQSPNVEAAKPLVYATTILLLLIVVLLNAVAIVIRNRLRRRFSTSGV